MDTSWLSVVSYGVGILGVIGGGIGFIRFGDYKATVKLQNDNIKALKDKLTILEDDLTEEKKARAESEKTISNLEGKLQSYKEIPLQQISTSLAQLANTMSAVDSSNKEILTTLKNSALIAATEATDGGLLVKTEKTITMPGKAA